MLVEHSNRRTFPVDRHAGLAVAGVAADGRAVVGRTQAEARQYKQFYGHPIPGHVLADRVASYVHIFNLYWYVRPMGVTSLLAAYDEQEGPALYCVDPAGNVHVRLFLCQGRGKNPEERVHDHAGRVRRACVERWKRVHRVSRQPCTAPCPIDNAPAPSQRTLRSGTTARRWARDGRWRGTRSRSST